MILLKKIKEYFEKRAEKRIKEYIDTVDIKLEKYRFFYEDFAEIAMNSISDIDWRIACFINDGGRLIYAYAPDAYEQIKQCDNYCLTENEDETKLNDLVRNVWIERNRLSYRMKPLMLDSYYQNIRDYYNTLYNQNALLSLNSPTLEQDVEQHHNNQTNYLIIIQPQLIERMNNDLQPIE